MNTKLNSIQALRGLAALLVVFFHVAGGMEEYYGQYIVSQLFSCGFIGVDIFFVISGFIMYYVHEKDIDQPKRWSKYIKKRLSRIYLPYWIAFLAPFLIYYFQGRIGDGREMSFSSVISSFLLFPQEGRTVLVISWTLVYEMFFYFIFGLLILNKRAGIACILIWGGLILAHQFLDLPFPILQWVDARNLEFFIGIGTAIVIKKYPIPNMLWIIGLLMMIGSIAWVATLQPSFGWPAAIATAVFIVGSTHSASFNAWIPKWLLSTGAMSYSLYLAHTPIMLLSYKILIAMHVESPLLAFIITLSCCILASIAFYSLIEKKLQPKAKPLASSYN